MSFNWNCSCTFHSKLFSIPNSPLKGESFIFFSFSYGIFPFRYEWPLWLWLCGQSHRWPLFVYGGGYAVSHSEPSALIPLIDYIFFHIGLWAWLWHMVIGRLWFYMVIGHHIPYYEKHEKLRRVELCFSNFLALFTNII